MGASGNCTNASEELAPTLSMSDMLQHCRGGGTLGVEVLTDATQAQVQSVVEAELVRMLPAADSCSSMSHGGPDAAVVHDGTTRGHHCQGKMRGCQERLQALLTLLAAWHAVCLRAEKFLYVKQLCTTLIGAGQRSTPSLRKMIRKYINTVQHVCKNMHGFVLDIPCAA